MCTLGLRAAASDRSFSLPTAELCLHVGEARSGSPFAECVYDAVAPEARGAHADLFFFAATSRTGRTEKRACDFGRSDTAGAVRTGRVLTCAAGHLLSLLKCGWPCSLLLLMLLKYDRGLATIMGGWSLSLAQPLACGIFLHSQLSPCAGAQKTPRARALFRPVVSRGRGLVLQTTRAKRSLRFAIPMQDAAAVPATQF